MSRILVSIQGVILLVGLFFGNVSGAEQFTAYDVANINQVLDVKISPDGQNIAYVLWNQRNPFEEENGGAWHELHVVDQQGSTKPYVSNQADVSNIDWTPDGKNISFLEKRENDDHQSVYVISADGGEARKILDYEESITAYSWSPDGQKVAFLATRAKSEEKEKLEEKGFNQKVYEEEWRPKQLWIADLSGEEPEKRLLELPGSASEMHWSPDGEHIALALAPTSLIDDYYMYRRVKIVEVQTGQIVTEVDNPGKLGEIAWSPDGSHIAVVAGLDINDTKEGRLMVASVNDGELQNILENYEGHVSDIAWRDEDTILYIGDEGVWATFNQIRRDGSRQKMLIEAGGPVLEGFSLSGDGKQVAFHAEAPEHPGEVFSYRVGRKLERLTNSNSWLKNKTFGEQEVVTWTARDGLKLQGVLIKPINFDEEERYPLILSVHGGPEAHDINGWLTSYSDPGQVGASEGYAVFYPNYRGSTGRGVELAKLSQNDPAGKEFDDLVDAVDHFIDEGLADGDRIGITGGSYGGFATAWSSTYYTERFAAGVMFVGISDRISKMGTTDIPWEMYLVHDARWPWNAWEHYRETSPLYYVKQADTPLLIMHGEDDPRVHPSQSMELFRYLKVLDQTPVRLVFYPGEGHGNRKVAARLDYNLRMMRWFNHYLQGPGGDKPNYEIGYEEEELE